jgi:hypothetical protein
VPDDLLSVLGTKPKYQLAIASERYAGPFEQPIKSPHSSGGDKVARASVRWQVLKATPQDLDTLQLQTALDLSKKRGLFLIGFNQSDSQVGRYDPESQPRKSSPAANVGQPTCLDRHHPSGKHAFPEVALEYLPRVGKGCKVNLLIPVE